tara:strand:+ start:108391 stop:108867 length:477 start_codon:yes stop_codon:yes gene_type:complete
MKNLLSATAIALMVTSAFSTKGLADDADARAARIMWSAFQCYSYADRAGLKEEAEGLFIVGYEAGQQFLSAARAGLITDKEASSNVPIIVTLLLGGPSDDFMIGRVFENAITDASDKIIKEDARGLPLAIDDWHTDPELLGTIARTKYETSNCAVILN